MCSDTLTISSFLFRLFHEVFHCLPYTATRIALYGILEGSGVRDLEFWENVQTHTKKF